MPIIVEENQKGKLKRRQSYRSQRENISEDSNGYDEADGMKYGGMKKKKKLKTKKAVLGMMMVGKTTKDEKKPMPIAGAASMAKLDVMKKMLGMKHGGMHKKKKYNIGGEIIESLKDSYKRTKEGIKKSNEEYWNKVYRSPRKIKADAKRLTKTEGSFKTGGMSKARGTGIAIKGTNFKGIF
jgi:hypothetical protein